MKRTSEHIRDHLLKDVHLDEVGDKAETLESLRLSEWSKEFETLMRNRLLMGRFRYGRMDRKDDRNYDRVGSILNRLTLYERTRNLEHLVDIANLAKMEFVHADHPDTHFSATDDGEHTRNLNES